MNLLIVCITIFLARILDVAIGTVRTIIMVRGSVWKNTILAFLEVFIWYIAARSALNTSYSSVFIAISYSLGYATGTYIGSIFSKKWLKGTTTVQIITSKGSRKNLNKIKENGFGLTCIPIDKVKKMILIEVDNRKINKLTEILEEVDEKAFVIYSDSKKISNGYF